MTIQEEVIDIITESGSMGFKRPLQILYFLIIRKASREPTFAENVEAHLKMPRKSVYNCLNDLYGNRFIVWDYLLKGLNKKLIEITEEGEKFVHEKILPLFTHHQDLIRDIIENKLKIDEISKINFFEDFLSFVTPGIMKLFKDWIVAQMGSVVPNTCFQGFETHFVTYFSTQIRFYLKKKIKEKL